MGRGRRGGRTRAGGWAAALALAAPALAGCAVRAADGAATPAADAPARVVLDAYLRALEAGDCDAARAISTPTFTGGNGDLCGDVRVSSSSVTEPAAAPEPDHLTYATVLVTEGGDDTLPAGVTTWFYRLERTAGGWRVAGGGSGP
ncbi:hypothetical protein [Nostocoides sp. Soil756]|jgi:hypothetical protein|uniref:hypothetical protein n=1 Tax=Nostocoides sp. Soil756 TaxID=1736399 RepID=UPI0006FDBDB9|nr:hypothetical protein [Tetrasphaera sp. Soil756]KRE60671.1 hypothetical protein ASG78_14200 [Tetrasphaera sp. Soil756]